MSRVAGDVPDTRRRNMAAVRSRDTKPEMMVRRLLHRLGYRYRLHPRDLPGRPDIVFPARRKAVEIRGCFWHAHPGCRHATLPATRRDWWKAKLDGNAARDARNVAALEAMGWTVLVLWQCELADPAAVETRLRAFLGPPGGERRRAVVDLFSCGGGMSAGFAGRPGWRLAAAVDLEVAKPSGKDSGETGCNAIYEANHGLRPIAADLSVLEPAELRRMAGLEPGAVACLISCAPCTDFSRANPANHGQDRTRNSLVGRSGDFVADLRPEVFLMENARELITGNHSRHWLELRDRLANLGYDVRADVHVLSRFGLPQGRERALIVASRVGPARTLEDLWEGWSVAPEAVTVRSALGRLAEWLAEHPDDPDGAACPGTGRAVAARLAATPRDGGGWIDVARDPRTRHLCTDDCRRRWAAGDPGSHPDVYGRLWWDRPAPTIKRECAHVGNGRYAHPEENRLLTVREMATLQGFPFRYRFPVRSVANRYRAIGDAVPPLIAWQIAACVDWMLTGCRPEPEAWVMPETCLRTTDLRRAGGWSNMRFM
ncbi:DNA mismatch endonuclease Vsr [Azospirillum halopraeferens]|uniref:DNA mismatch endonuclease Vsr n=1 Tax=Azospirillum halopraeferens TaxID=34010 RepID=UPI00040BB41F|nr:DNA mismatch endonuclease Vsr [Azospirillum halopraeferens]